VNEDIGAAPVRLDEAEAFVGIEEFYSASLCHASGPFLSARHPHGQHHSIASLAGGVGRQFLKFEKKVPSTSACSRQDFRPPFSEPADRNISVPGAQILKDFPCSQNARTR
jgi:hypothetical protein